jgi:hypothetical protein
MDRLIRDPAASRAMGAAGRERYLERFTVDRFREELRRVYEDATAPQA